jgi:hypothetical protein
VAPIARTIAGLDASRRTSRHGATRWTAAPRLRRTPYGTPVSPMPAVTGVREPAPGFDINVIIAMMQEVEEMVMPMVIVLEVSPREEQEAGVQDEARTVATSVGVAELLLVTSSAATSTRWQARAWMHSWRGWVVALYSVVASASAKAPTRSRPTADITLQDFAGEVGVATCTLSSWSAPTSTTSRPNSCSTRCNGVGVLEPLFFSVYARTSTASPTLGWMQTYLVMRAAASEL